MPDSLSKKIIKRRRYALCIGIGKYTELINHDLRYAVPDARTIAERLKDPQRGNFEVTLLTEPAQTTEQALRLALDGVVNAPSLNAEDLVVIYISCHGNVYGKGNTFYLLPSDAKLEADGMPQKTSIIDIHFLATTLSDARVKNIIFLLDVCHSGGAGITFQHLNLNLNPDTNLYMIGAARHDQVASQSSKLQHGIFTYHLLQAFEQKPQRDDGWLTISQIHSYIADAIKPEQIQAQSAVTTPNIPFVKNPQYSAQSLTFHEEVKKLLRLIQYEPMDTDIPKGAPAGYYVTELKAGLRIRRVGIIPYYNEIEPLLLDHAEAIARFVKEQVKQANLDEGLLVTSAEVSDDIKGKIRRRDGRLLDVRTYQNIWKNLIDFTKYLQKLINDYETSSPDLLDDPPLAKVYIPLNAERRQYIRTADTSIVDEMETASTEKDKREYQIIRQGDIESEVQHWLANTDPTNTKLAILADYGSGKSTFCRHIAAILAKGRQATKKLERHEYRIPILIPLLEFAKAPVDLEGYLVSQLKRHCKVDNPDFEALIKMAEAGLLLFILDGFDEMASRATTDTIFQNIALFEKLTNISQNKVLLTTRPEYFMNFSQEQKVLATYPRLYLQPLNPVQVDRYLQKRVPFIKPRDGETMKTWEYYRQQINQIHDLSDLMKRPVLLEMIIKTLPVLVEEGRPVNRPNLYQHYLEGELERQLRKQRRDLMIDRQKRFEIMERIALELYRTDRPTLSSNLILEISKELLTSEMRSEMEGSLREILTCSFLLREGDEYRFSHQSFQEYLIAFRLAKDIRADKQENFALKRLSGTIQGFLLEFTKDASPDNLFTDKSVEKNVIFDSRKLMSWFRANPDSRYMSSNAFSLIVRLFPHNEICKLPLKGADLSGADLSHADLSHADLSGADLSGADLSHADLSHADLRGARLFNVDLTGANLSHAKLHRAVLRNAYLEFAFLEEAELNGADLTGSFLDSTNLSEANLTNAILNGAHLREANLVGADLTDASLYDAEFTRADLTGADLTGAKLNGADFIDANLTSAKLVGVDITGVDLTKSKLPTAMLIDMKKGITLWEQETIDN